MPGRHRAVRPPARQRLVLPLLLLLVGSSLSFLVVTPPAQGNIPSGGEFTRVFNQNTNGGILIRGNTLMTCRPTDTTCTAKRSVAGGGTPNSQAYNNNDYAMDYVNVDAGVSGIFDSSRSTVDLPAGATVLFAALVWSGRTSAGGTTGGVAGAAAPSPTQKSTVRLRAPGASGYTTVTSSRQLAAGDAFQGYADVTAQVRAGGSGDWTVGNVQAGTGTDRYAGWSLAIAYSDPTAPLRNLTVFSGFGSLVVTNDVPETVDIPVSGFTTPPSGAVRTTLGAVVYEGDAGSNGDQFLLGPDTAHLTKVSDALHAPTNVFNSVISTLGVDPKDRTPAYSNNLGFDAGTFSVNGVLPNGSTSAVLRLTTSSETFYPGLVSFATDLYAPQIDLTKTATFAKAAGNTQSGSLEPGDTVTYRITGRNSGSDAAAPTLLTDRVPDGTTYVPGSLTVSGSPATDAAGDDRARYSATDDQITVNLGSGATPTAGGSVAVAADTEPVTFQVVVDPVVGSANLTNTARIDYTGVSSGRSVFGASNTLLAVAAAHRSDLGVSLLGDPDTVQRAAGSTVTYRATVTNRGPYDEPAARLTDTLPAGATVLSTTPSAGSCSTASGTVTCALGALASGATATVTVALRLTGAPQLATSTARVSGDNADDTPGNDSSAATTRVNTAPSAVADSISTVDGARTFDAVANDTDADPDTLVVSSAGTASHGSVVRNGDGTLTYTADTGWAGPDGFDYTVSDGHGGTATGTVSVTVPNRAPTAVDDAAATPPGSPVDVEVLANDSDPNVPATPGQSLTVDRFTQPMGGTGTVTRARSALRFTPSAGFVRGTATFTYTVSDGAGGSATATVTVTAADVGPVAVDDTAGTPYRTPVDVDVRANDTDANDDTLTVTSVTGATHGTATVQGGRVHYEPASGWSGSDTLTYTVRDDAGLADTGHLVVTTGNADPTAGDLGRAVPGGEASTLEVLTHASDPNGDPLSVIGAGPAAHGTVGVTGTDRVVYTPTAGFRGEDSFGYTVSDGHGGTATGTVTVTVANQAPGARDDTALAPIGGSVDIDVLGNDTDPNGDPLTVDATTEPGHGAATVRADGSVTYRPADGYDGSDSFTYTATDGHGGSSTATVTVTVPDQPPVAVADERTLEGQVGAPITVDVVDNDTDPDGDPLHLVSVQHPDHGTASVQDGQVVYTPDPSFAGDDTVGYVVGDGRGGRSPGTLTVHVRNRAPVAGDDVLEVPAGAGTLLDVLANDRDPDGETLHVADLDASSTAGGTVALVDGRPRYTPPAGYVGPDSFRYTVADPRGRSDGATVRLRVGNHEPVTGPDAPVLTGDAGAPATLDVLGDDSDDDGDTLTLASVTRPGHGTAEIRDSRVVYTPDVTFAGLDSFAYTVTDGHGGSSTQTVLVTVVNHPPVAVTDDYHVENTAASVLDVTGNDTDPDHEAVRLRSVTAPAHGTARIVDGHVSYTPTAGYTGPDGFDYVVQDARGLAGDPVAVTLTVSAPAGNQAPVPSTETPVLTGPVGAPSLIDVLHNDTDPDGDTLLLLSVGRPGHGTAEIVDGAIRYTPDPTFAGVDSFTYTVSDGHGGVSTETVQVTVVDRPPTPARDTGTASAGVGRLVDVLANDTDPDGDPLTLLSVGRPAHGTARIVSEHVLYTAAAGFVGVDSFTYTVRDARGQLTTSTVRMRVAAAADGTPTTSPTSAATPAASTTRSVTTSATPSSTGLATGSTSTVDGGDAAGLTGVTTVSDDRTLAETGGPRGWLPAAGAGLLLAGLALIRTGRPRALPRHRA